MSHRDPLSSARESPRQSTTARPWSWPVRSRPCRNGSNRVNITNNSRAAAGILVSGTHQQVGNIDGSGTTQVNAGSDLTANHIIQSALVIGGTAGSHGLVTIAASDISGNPPAESDGLTLATSLTPSGPFGAYGTGFANLSRGNNAYLGSLVTGRFRGGRQSLGGSRAVHVAAGAPRAFEFGWPENRATARDR